MVQGSRVMAKLNYVHAIYLSVVTVPLFLSVYTLNCNIVVVF